MPAIKIRIPKVDRGFYGEGSLPAVVKTRLAEALSSLDIRDAPNVPPLSMSTDAVTIWISGEQQAAIDLLGHTHHIPGSGPVASGLLHAWARSELGALEPVGTTVGTGAQTTLDSINLALGDQTRVDQARFFADLSSEVMARRPAHEVVFAEASTGVGKSRAFLALVVDWCAANPGEHAVIAAPSYNVLLQILSQWGRIEDVYDAPDSQVLLGQQEFVSQHALEALLVEHPDTPGAELARSWMQGGGKPPVDDAFGHPWLMRSLDVATGGEWTLTNEVLLASDVGEDDAGMVSYRAQFADAREASVVFCTHAMLAVDVRLRTSQAVKGFSEDNEGQSVANVAWEKWLALDEKEKKTSRNWELRNELLREQIRSDVGRLPTIGLLIVDEAHLLEQAFAQVFASGASMARLMAVLRRLHEVAPKAVLARDMSAMSDLWHSMKDVGAVVGTDRVMTRDNQVLAEAVNGVRALMTTIMGRLHGKVLTRPEARQLRSMQLALDVASRANGERTGMSTRVSWSPSVQWPSIEVGRYDVSRELDFLWALAVQDRSVLISATLYEEVSRAGLESTRRILSVRSNLVRPLVPVRPSWLYEPVTLQLVGEVAHADGLPRFRRPTKNDRLDPLDFDERLERWRGDVADYVGLAYASAAGGVLVLLTSHTERTEILSRLGDQVPANCLLTQGDGRSLDSLRIAFLEMVAAGRRPCLLAVGAAWTGLDLSGAGLSAVTGKAVKPSEDNVLTDLIIPTAPIGTNRSLTHEWRRERMGMMAEVGATSITFRQGIGRLIRGEGMPHNRRLHFLDARIHEAKWRWALQPVLRALTRYTKRKVV